MGGEEVEGSVERSEWNIKQLLAYINLKLKRGVHYNFEVVVSHENEFH